MERAKKIILIFSLMIGYLFVMYYVAKSGVIVDKWLRTKHPKLVNETKW